MRKIDTTLFFAIMERNKSKVIFAIKEGADVNCRNKWGSTPLHIASLMNEPDIVKLLIENNADITIRNRWNVSPMGLTPADSESGKILRKMFSSL